VVRQSAPPCMHDALLAVAARVETQEPVAALIHGDGVYVFGWCLLMRRVKAAVACLSAFPCKPRATCGCVLTQTWVQTYRYPTCVCREVCTVHMSKKDRAVLVRACAR